MPSAEQQKESLQDMRPVDVELTPPSKVRVTDKRGGNAEETSLVTAPKQEDKTLPPKVVVTDEPEHDPVDVLIAKVFNFVLDQPEYFAVLRLSRNERKRLEKGIAKLMTRFPTVGKT